MTSEGSGPGAITPDGCAVEVYALLEAGEEPALIQAAVPVGASLLELGAGTGRITKHLVAAGYRVTAVDESAPMLARFQAAGAERVLARIEDLDLARTFEAVLLMSHLVNTDDVRRRHDFLLCCRRHLAPGGVLVVQRHPPEWFAHAKHVDVVDGRVVVRLRDVSRPTPQTVRATVHYENNGLVWTQTFTAACLDDDDVKVALAAAGLAFGQWLDPGRSWFTARHPGGAS